MRRDGFLAAGLAALLLAVAGSAQSLAQGAAPSAPAPGGAAPADPPAGAPRPRPKPRPKPPAKPKPKPPVAQEAAPRTDAAGTANEAGSKPVPGALASPPLTSPQVTSPPLTSPQAEPDASAAAPATASSDPSLPIACELGKAVHYDGPKEFSLWVTRSGTVRVDNPLRPLTPVVTRTLQLVIGDRLATAYGPDLLALRRGGSPAALESTLGGPIQWDARLGNLPDPLAILGDSGELLAELRFKECGDAPAIKAAPVAKGKKGERNKAARRDIEAPPPADQAAPPARLKPAAPPPRRLPQGAIPE